MGGRILYGHVQAQSLSSLVHRRGYGRDGVHRGRVEYERSRVGVPAVPRCHRRGRRRVRRRRGRVRYGTVEEHTRLESEELTSIRKMVAYVSEPCVRFNLEQRATLISFVRTDHMQDIRTGEV